jgi:aerobic carbon-monoxide dehydrogenase large subunit
MEAKSPDRATVEPRVEDDVLLRGQGRYIADGRWPNQAYACFVRSPHACARIAGVNAAAAREAPGIVGVLTGSDAAELGSIGRHPPLAGRGGKPLITPHRPALAATRVMHVGEPVAMVVGESAAAAQDAAELVAVDYEPLPGVTDARAALVPGAPQVWPEAPGNLAIDWPGLAADPEANAREVDAMFKAAKFVARIAVTNQRIAIASMEPRGATASYDAQGDKIRCASARRARASCATISPSSSKSRRRGCGC